MSIPPTAAAHTVAGHHFDWQDHSFEDPIELDTCDGPVEAGALAPIEDNITDAIDAWNGLGIDLYPPRGGQTSSTVFEADGHRSIVDDPGDGSSAGATIAYALSCAWTDFSPTD